LKRRATTRTGTNLLRRTTPPEAGDLVGRTADARTDAVLSRATADSTARIRATGAIDASLSARTTNRAASLTRLAGDAAAGACRPSCRSDAEAAAAGVAPLTAYAVAARDAAWAAEVHRRIAALIARATTSGCFGAADDSAGQTSAGGNYDPTTAAASAATARGTFVQTRTIGSGAARLGERRIIDG
jgi:hypothetical protein